MQLKVDEVAETIVNVLAHELVRDGILSARAIICSPGSHRLGQHLQRQKRLNSYGYPLARHHLSIVYLP